MMYRHDDRNQRHSGGRKARSEMERKRISKRSMSRSRENVMEIVSCNEGTFKSFLTLTYAEEMENYYKAYGDLKVYLEQVRRRMRKNGQQLKYLGVPEIQTERANKTGKFVIHFHLLTNIELGSDLIPKRENKRIHDRSGNYYTLQYYDLPYWKHGYSRANEVANGDENFNLGKYLLKYMCKGFDDKFYGMKKVFRSHNLEKKKVRYILNPDEIEKIKAEYEPYKVQEYKSFNIAHVPAFVEREYKLPKQ